MVENPRKDTARHEFCFSWLLLETVVGARAPLVASFLVARTLITEGFMSSKREPIKLRTLFILGALLIVVGVMVMKSVSSLAGGIINILGQILILDAIITAIVRKFRRKPEA